MHCNILARFQCIEKNALEIYMYLTQCLEGKSQNNHYDFCCFFENAKSRWSSQIFSNHICQEVSRGRKQPPLVLGHMVLYKEKFIFSSPVHQVNM